MNFDLPLSQQHPETARELVPALGRANDAISALERARAQEPLAPAFAGFLSQAYLAAGNTAAALVEVDRGLALEGLDGYLHKTPLAAALTSGDRAEIEQGLRAFAATDSAAPQLVHPAMLYEPLLHEVRRLDGLESSSAISGSSTIGALRLAGLLPRGQSRRLRVPLISWTALRHATCKAWGF